MDYRRSERLGKRASRLEVEPTAHLELRRSVPRLEVKRPDGAEFRRSEHFKQRVPRLEVSPTGSTDFGRSRDFKQSAYFRQSYPRLELEPTVSNVSTRPDDNEPRNLLDWLSMVDYSAFQHECFAQSEDRSGGWLLDSSEFQDWLNSRHQTLFCPGIPGAGKTIMSSIVVEYLFDKFRYDANVGISYVYCNLRRQQEQNATHLLSNILKQLIADLPAIPEGLRALFEHHRPRRSKPSFNDILAILQRTVTHYSKCFIIVDALDECDESRSQLLSALFHLQNSANVHLFVTSRFGPSLETEFRGAISREIRASDEDVRNYLDTHMVQLPPSVTRNIELQEEIKREIIGLARGMFLLVRVYFETLLDKRSTRAIRNALKALSKNTGALDYTYQEALDRIEGQPLQSKQLAKQSLAWVLFAKRSLTTTELRYALAVEIGKPLLDEENVPEIEDVITVCAGLLAIQQRDDTVCLTHESARHFLERRQEDWCPQAQDMLTDACVTYLSFDIFNDSLCATQVDLQQRLDQAPFYDYAARFWGNHARVASSNTIQLILHFLESDAKVSNAYQAMVSPDIWTIQQERGRSSATAISVLHLAAYFGLESITNTLIEKGHAPNQRDSKMKTPLRWAAERGHEGVMRTLIKKDCITLPNVIREGDLHLTKTLLSAGYDPSTRGLWDRTPLHDAVQCKNLELTKELIAFGADINAKDSNHVTPLQIAVRIQDIKLIELLLQRSACTKDIEAGEWRRVYKRNTSDTIHFSQGASGKTLFFLPDHKLHKDIIPKRADDESERRLLHFAEYSPWEKGLMTNVGDGSEPNRLTITETEHKRSITYIVSIYFPIDKRKGRTDCFRLPCRERLTTSWNMMWMENENGEPCCKSMDHISMLPHVWIPDRSLHFLTQMITCLKTRWMELAECAQKHLTQCRQNILHANGDNPELVKGLLSDAQLWTELRNNLRDHITTAIKFAKTYSQQYHEEDAMKELQAVADEMYNDVETQLELLDRTSHQLIQMEFNLVSINEARRSTSTGTSMKRLSWVTFIFLPAMFAASLFGMNVDLLKNDPPWLWYLLFLGVLVFLTISGWLIFKYFPVESWAEHKADVWLTRFRSKRNHEPDEENIDDFEQHNIPVLPR